MTNVNSVLKSRDTTLPAKVHIVKAMVFPVVMCGCERWTTKKAELQGIDNFELWCWRRLLRVPWTAKKSNLGRPRGMVWGGRREEGSGWGTHVYLWRIHFDIWQNEYNYVKFKNKIKI